MLICVSKKCGNTFSDQKFLVKRKSCWESPHGEMNGYINCLNDQIQTKLQIQFCPLGLKETITKKIKPGKLVLKTLF